jgi:3-deoxy-7-phosphoheptulonate synthase
MKDISKKDMENNLTLVCRRDCMREVKAGDVTIGKDKLTVMAGPCTLESKTQIFEIAKKVKEAGAAMLRAGIFKPLTFPYGEPLGQPDAGSGEPPRDRRKIFDKKELFQNAERRLGYLKEAGEKHGLPVISEILYADSVDFMSEYVDMFQIGYRHMFNMDIIDALCRTNKPVMIKRHYGESLRSLLGVAEHFEARGKNNFVFCERGVAVPHTHNVESRSILDVQAIPALKEYAPSVPVIVDPSHSTFKRSYVIPMARAAIAAGADGLLIEVHQDPENAWVDPLQAIGFKDFERLMKEIQQIRNIIS